MLHFYLKLLLGIVITTVLAVVTAPLLGRMRPVNPVLDGILVGCEGEPQPCWYGIQPGKTALADALTLIQQTPFTVMDQYDQVLVLVYRNESTRCGVEIRSNSGVVDSLTIINCLDKQIGDVVRAMHNSSRKLPYSLGMVESLMSSEINDSIVNYLPCLNFTSYGQIIARPLTIAGEAPMTAPADWRDFLPYGWYVHHGGGLSCDVVSVPPFGIG